MITVFSLVTVAMLSISNQLSPVSASCVVRIDSLTMNCIAENTHMSPRRFLGTLPPVQGPGICSWEILLYEETRSELIDNDLVMWQHMLMMECSYNHAGFEVTTNYYFDQDENAVLCISSWWLNSEVLPLFMDRFYYSQGEVIAYAYDEESLVSPSESHREKGTARLAYLRYILDNIVSDSPGAPPVFMEQIEYIYENY